MWGSHNGKVQRGWMKTDSQDIGSYVTVCTSPVESLAGEWIKMVSWYPEMAGGKKSSFKELPTLPKHCFIRTEPRLKAKNTLVLKNLGSLAHLKKYWLKISTQKITVSFMICNPFAENSATRHLTSIPSLNVCHLILFFKILDLQTTTWIRLAFCQSRCLTSDWDEKWISS